MIYRLDPGQARSVLEQGRTAHLGCIVDDEPYVVPIHYATEGDCAYVRTLPGRKLDAMREQPRVCLQVEDDHGEYHWRSVMAFGTFEEITDEAEAERYTSLLFRRFPRLTPADSVRRHGHLDQYSIVFRIRIDRLTGIGEG
jgi:uncharacterized protein